MNRNFLALIGLLVSSSLQAEMRALLEAKYREVRAETPLWPHWKFVNLESEQIVWPPDDKKGPAAKKAGGDAK